ncbi:FAST_1 domain-containing protein [Haematococcus lacustris]|uniref:FAST_1 domain-containing protein n=1 Tax=Haematococcus lacustris TaxID=44745 RepID=A0A699ZP17_HAELA|nr:FAST_1 domain-containing protein [Haematococcus lacustris]
MLNTSGTKAADDLLGIVQQHGPDLDFTHVSQALTRLSSLEDQGQQVLVPPETSQTQPQVQDPSPSVAITLARLDPLLMALLPSGDSRGVSNALWAYSRLNHYRRHTFDALCRQAMRLKGQLDPLDCAQIMQAFGTFRHYHPDLLAAIPQALLEAACVAFQHNISSCCNKDVALMLWSLAKLQHYPGLRVLQLVESRMLDALFCRGMQKQRMQHLPMQSAAPELSGHANEVTNANAHGAQDSIRSLQEPQQGGPEAEATLVPQDIGNVLWAFGQLKYKAASLLDQLPRHLGAWLHTFNCADLCAVLYGYAHARHYHPGVLNALGPLLTPHLSSLSLKELVTVFWAFGIFQHRPPTAPLLLDGLAVALVACLERCRPQTLATLAKACANLRR